MKNTGIFLFNNVELLDFAGPFEAFSVADELSGYTLCKTFTFAENPEPVKSVNGLRSIPDYTFDTCPRIDILVIPGGDGTKKLLEDGDLLRTIMSIHENAEITLSVCSGARILAKLGLLDNLRYTTHHEVFGDITALAPRAVPIRGEKFVDNGRVMTSAGISAGIELSLHVIGKVFGETHRERTRAYMEYGDWDKK